MNRIDIKLKENLDNDVKSLIPYIVAGDPSMEFTLSMMHRLVADGADIIEIGIPFSDPMAEGPTIQLAHERALERNTSLTEILELVSSFRQKDPHTPVVLMGYANPIERMGYAVFAEKAQLCGVDGVLIVDMPPEEAESLNAEFKAHNLHMVFLIAPTTTEERIEKIVNLASGYIYYVSLKGVTGAGHLDVDDVASKVNLIRSKTSLPICVGFGIKDPDSATSIAKIADGVVVGSALVNRIAELQNSTSDVDKDAAQVSQLVQEIKTALNSISG